MGIVRDSQHSDGAPTVEGTGIRVKDIAVAYEHSGYEPDEVTESRGESPVLERRMNPPISLQPT
jgi:hypothetical protein